MTKMRVILADDNQKIIEAAKRLLEPEFQVVGSVQCGRSLVECVERLHPDVVVTDISMPDSSGFAAANQLTQHGNAAKIVFLTIHADADFVDAALATGASAYVVKARMATELIHAIREALAGRIFVSPPFGKQERASAGASGGEK
jgi:DNA-binding NarL/FixJ family response regulator